MQNWSEFIWSRIILTILKFLKNSEFLEFPLLTTRFLGKKIPAGGGFYLRFLPLKTIKNAIKSNEKDQIPATFYIHSWELTPEFMPKISLPVKDNFITYHNLNKALPKMTEIIQNFEFTSFEKYILKWFQSFFNSIF